jgi:hypothetical protein
VVTSDDGNTIDAAAGDQSLSGGTLNYGIYFNAAESWTVTATDTTNTNITSSTSSPFTVQ